MLLWQQYLLALSQVTLFWHPFSLCKSLSILGIQATWLSYDFSSLVDSGKFWGSLEVFRLIASVLGFFKYLFVIFSLLSLWLENILCILCILLNLFIKTYFMVYFRHCSMYNYWVECFIIMSWLKMCKSSILSYFFLSVTKGGVLKLSAMIVSLLIFHFMYFEHRYLGLLWFLDKLILLSLWNVPFLLWKCLS